jgi:hypothetical protein
MGKIAGSVKLSGKGPFPKVLTATTLAPRARTAEPPPKGKMDCPIDAQGKWSCALPTSTYDLVFEAAGFSPQYRWAVRVRPGKASDVGVVELKRGASVTGWAAVEEGAFDPASCRAHLAPYLSPGRGVEMAQKVAATTLETRVGKDGFFQFNAVPAGIYSLEVRQKGFAPASLSPIEVRPLTETSLREPLTLRRPFELLIAISPPVDWLGQHWRVEVNRVDSATPGVQAEAYAGSADEQGAVAVPGQAPGRFSVQVADSRENRLFFKFLNFSPAEARQEVELKLLTVQGTVKLGKEPLAATLWFGGLYGSPGVKMESGTDGKFHGVLPKDG